MFKIKQLIENNRNLIELTNEDNSAKAIISLNEGGRLFSLVLKRKQLIKEISNFEYKNSYASSILFPFSSRIENGKYTFLNKEYQFYCNDLGKNALHGLVYNKRFEIEKIIESKTYASVTIAYEGDKENLGFPYTYKILLTYTLFEKEIRLSIKIENTDCKPFPFTLGWHPYFYSDNLKDSVLRFSSNKKIEFNENLITKSVIDIEAKNILNLEDKQLDDCFILNSGTIEFSTPNYQIEIVSNQTENYLQLYTPKNLPIIAIEPMTGVSNSHNNKIGLQVLEPKKNHSIIWSVKLIN